ncbi:MAG: type II toxin-antitoxin system VapC family toxin [Erysipelotrichaceae bacterium]|nr:type II toxin-antitoxin system VapC family toxin [Erysipelotrichaceae bacterium]
MDIILDTHIALWALDGDRRLPKKAQDLISDENNYVYFSAVSVMEVSIKHEKKSQEIDRLGRTFYQECLDAGYYTMPLKPKHAMWLDDLKVKEDAYVNRDPFDRALIAQAKQENMILLTHDRIMEYYDEPCIMLV